MFYLVCFLYLIDIIQLRSASVKIFRAFLYANRLRRKLYDSLTSHNQAEAESGAERNNILKKNRHILQLFINKLL